MIETKVMMPLRAPYVAEYTIDDEVTLFNTHGGQVHILNTSGAVVWRLCDGSRTIDELIEDVAIVFETDPSVVESDVRELIADLQGANLLTVRMRQHTE